jgi:hypothetical protein
VKIGDRHQIRKWKVVSDIQKSKLILIQLNLLQQKRTLKIFKCTNKFLITLMMIMIICLHPWISEKLLSNMVGSILLKALFMWQCQTLMWIQTVRLVLRSLWNLWQHILAIKIQKIKLKESSVTLMKRTKVSLVLRICWHVLRN